MIKILNLVVHVKSTLNVFEFCAVVCLIPVKNTSNNTIGIQNTPNNACQFINPLYSQTMDESDEKNNKKYIFCGICAEETRNGTKKVTFNGCALQIQQLNCCHFFILFVCFVFFVSENIQSKCEIIISSQYFVNLQYLRHWNVELIRVNLQKFIVVFAIGVRYHIMHPENTNNQFLTAVIKRIEWRQYVTAITTTMWHATETNKTTNTTSLVFLFFFAN